MTEIILESWIKLEMWLEDVATYLMPEGPGDVKVCVMPEWPGHSGYRGRLPQKIWSSFTVGCVELKVLLWPLTGDFQTHRSGN